MIHEMTPSGNPILPSFLKKLRDRVGRACALPNTAPRRALSGGNHSVAKKQPPAALPGAKLLKSWTNRLYAWFRLLRRCPQCILRGSFQKGAAGGTSWILTRQL